MWDVTCCMMKAEEEERWIFNKLKRQKSWEVRGLKELKKVNSFNGWSYAGTVAEWKCLHKKDWEKCFPNSCHFWKQCNVYWQNIYILSHKGHCWTLWCFFFFFICVEWKIRVAEWQTKQVPAALLQKFRLKINITAYGGASGVLVALGLLQPKL